MTTAFLERPDTARIAGELASLWDLDRVLAAFDGERMCGTFRSWATELTVPGGAQHRPTRYRVSASCRPIDDRGSCAGWWPRPTTRCAIAGSRCPSSTRRSTRSTVGLAMAPPAGGDLDPGRVRYRVPRHPDGQRRVPAAQPRDPRHHPGRLRRGSHASDGGDPPARPHLGLRSQSPGQRVGLPVEGLRGGPSRRCRVGRRVRSLPRGDEVGAAPAAEHHRGRRPAHADRRCGRGALAVPGRDGLGVERESASPLARDRLPWLLTNARAATLGEVGDGLWVRLLDIPRALAAGRTRSPPPWSSRWPIPTPRVAGCASSSRPGRTDRRVGRQSARRTYTWTSRRSGPCTSEVRGCAMPLDRDRGRERAPSGRPRRDRAPVPYRRCAMVLHVLLEAAP